jgi:hypothetical protein
MPAKAAFSVRVKDQEDFPPIPSLHIPSITILPPLPPRIVLMMTRAMIYWSPGLDIEPVDPPLKARNPAMRIMPPIPVSCRQTPLVSFKILREHLNLFDTQQNPYPKAGDDKIEGFHLYESKKNLCSRYINIKVKFSLSIVFKLSTTP